jgi:hypothetical protein
MRYVQYHRDGTVRMDWYTFRNMSIDKVMRTVSSNARTTKPHTVRPTSKRRGVKQFI